MVANASTWIKFFVSAGVPSVTAAKYAHVFYENRIQMDMLVDLNKEYLREMGINPMGDIIAILRHAKSVYEQNAREKIMSQESEQIPVAAVLAVAATSSIGQPKANHHTSMKDRKIILSPIAAVPRSVRSEVASLTAADAEPPSKPAHDVLVPKQARRVLPEHEGRYKITLPSGTTKRSQEILAKKAMLYSDKEEKKGVFDRLQLNNIDMDLTEADDSHQPIIKITGLEKPTSSVFARLGGMNDNQSDVITKHARSFAGILKNSTPKAPVGIVKKSLKSQKVILVKKQPAKAATMISDDDDDDDGAYYDSRIESGEKSVSFSSEDEVLEIAARKQPKTTETRTPKSSAAPSTNTSVRDRLGFKSKLLDSKLHRTRQSVSLKPTVDKRHLSVSAALPKMQSDTLLQNRKVSVQSRLTMKQQNDGTNGSSPVRQLARLSLSTSKRRVSTKSLSTASSVFTRLGFSE